MKYPLNFVKGVQIMWEIFEQLLQEKGITAYQVCRDLNIAQSTISNWKARRNVIGSEMALKIAAYLDVSVDYLLTGDKKKRYYENDETVRKAQEAYTKNRSLFDAIEGSKPEDIQMAVDLLERLKATNV